MSSENCTEVFAGLDWRAHHAVSVIDAAGKVLERFEIATTATAWPS